jgi:hypothetical protein
MSRPAVPDLAALERYAASAPGLTATPRARLLSTLLRRAYQLGYGRGYGRARKGKPRVRGAA